MQKAHKSREFTFRPHSNKYDYELAINSTNDFRALATLQKCDIEIFTEVGNDFKDFVAEEKEFIKNLDITKHLDLNNHITSVTCDGGYGGDNTQRNIRESDLDLAYYKNTKYIKSLKSKYGENFKLDTLVYPQKMNQEEVYTSYNLLISFLMGLGREHCDLIFDPKQYTQDPDQISIKIPNDYSDDYSFLKSIDIKITAKKLKEILTFVYIIRFSNEASKDKLDQAFTFLPKALQDKVGKIGLNEESPSNFSLDEIIQSVVDTYAEVDEQNYQKYLINMQNLEDEQNKIRLEKERLKQEKRERVETTITNHLNRFSPERLMVRFKNEIATITLYQDDWDEVRSCFDDSDWQKLEGIMKCETGVSEGKPFIKIIIEESNMNQFEKMLECGGRAYTAYKLITTWQGGNKESFADTRYTPNAPVSYFKGYYIEVDEEFFKQHELSKIFTQINIAPHAQKDMQNEGQTPTIYFIVPENKMDHFLQALEKKLSPELSQARN
jgi:hypothetical protein